MKREVRAKRKLIVHQVAELTNVNHFVILTTLCCLNLFHNSYTFKMLLFRFDADNDAIKREQSQTRLSSAEREHHRGQFLTGRKGTANFSFPQEGTFWWDSYQKVGIGMLSQFRKMHFNSD